MTRTPGTIVIALGGNALAPPGERATIVDQFRHARESLAAVVEMAADGWRIVVVHGNGPQVGNALLRNELARDRLEPLPLGVLVAVTAGWIGYMLQQSLQNAFIAAGVNRDVLTVITQTVVDLNDPKTTEPTKPIGLALSPEEVADFAKRGIPVQEDKSGRVRRLVPSPVPQDIVEAAAIRELVDAGKIVIAAGGGGAPVYYDRPGHLEGLDAVVDKDRVAAILGRCLNADTLLILTNVLGVYRNWGSPGEKLLRCLTADEASSLVTGGELGSGSMQPKVMAAVEFLEHGGRRSIIAHLDEAQAALQGLAGTHITRRAE